MSGLLARESPDVFFDEVCEQDRKRRTQNDKDCFAESIAKTWGTSFTPQLCIDGSSDGASQVELPKKIWSFIEAFDNEHLPHLILA